jgi:hypothetical protein
MGEGTFDGRDHSGNEFDSTHVLQELYTLVFRSPNGEFDPKKVDCTSVLAAFLALRNNPDLKIILPGVVPKNDLQKAFLRYVEVSRRNRGWATALLRLVTAMDYTDEEIAVAFADIHLYQEDIRRLNAASKYLHLRSYFKLHDDIHAIDSEEDDRNITRIMDPNRNDVATSVEVSLESSTGEIEDISLEILKRLSEGTHKRIPKKYHSTVVIESLLLSVYSKRYRQTVSSFITESEDLKIKAYVQTVEAIERKKDFELPLCRLLMLLGYSKFAISEGVSLFMEEVGIEIDDFDVSSKWDAAFTNLNFEADLLLGRHLYH